MFSLFTSKQSTLNPLSRINQRKELAQVVHLLQAFKYKEQDLKKAADSNGFGSIDYRKHFVFEELLIQAEKIKNEFNNSPVKNDPKEEIKDILKFLNDLHYLIRKTYDQYESILTTPRNSNKEMLKNAAYYATYSTTVVTGVALSNLAGLFAFFYLGPKVAKSASTIAYMNDNITESNKLFVSALETLEFIRSNLVFTQSFAAFATDAEHPVEYLCPISRMIMQNPVICTLDRQTYEAETITKWLTANRRSPYNNKQMEDHQSVDDVLCKNANLQDAIERYRTTHPEAFEESLSRCKH